MSERDGSYIERLLNRLKILSVKFRVVLCRTRLSPTLIFKRKWLLYELPLIFLNIFFKFYLLHAIHYFQIEIEHHNLDMDLHLMVYHSFSSMLVVAINHSLYTGAILIRDKRTVYLGLGQDRIRRRRPVIPCP